MYFTSPVMVTMATSYSSVISLEGVRRAPAYWTLAQHVAAFCFLTQL